MNNVLWFALWWGTHSILARKRVKVSIASHLFMCSHDHNERNVHYFGLLQETLGLWQHPLERPLFATWAWIVWGLNVHFWKPINTCTSWNPLEVPIHVWAISGSIFTAGVILIVGLLWSLPDHVFGTARYQYEQGKSILAAKLS